MWRPKRIDYRNASWKLAVGLLTWYVWDVTSTLLAIYWLAALAAACFAAAAILAGQPHLWRSPGPQDSGPRMVRLTNLTGTFAAVVILMGIAAALPAARYLTADYDQALAEATTYRPTVSTRVYSADDELICNLTLQDRVLVRLPQVPVRVRQAFIAAEDQDFYDHHGIDLMAIVRALAANQQSGRHKQGGSTITQQVVKQVVIKDNEKSYTRKAREILLAVRLERSATKDEILEVYLNQIFLGHGTYGIQAAAQTYFGKDVTQLSLAEAAILAGLPKAPSRDSPYNFFARSKERQVYVLGRMLESGYIDRPTMESALAEDVAVIERSDPINLTAAPYFCEHVRKELTRLYGYEAIYEKGLTVKTTLDMRMQRAAEAAVRRGLVDLERRLGFNGPEGRDVVSANACGPALEPVTDGVTQIGRVISIGRSGVALCVNGRSFPMDPEDVQRIYGWEAGTGNKLAIGDLLSVRIETRGKEQRFAVSARRTAGPDHPEALQAGLIAIDPRTGALKALVGGYDYAENQFNAVTQARRQTGSSVKPYVYLTALMSGRTVDEMVTDQPVCYGTASGIWCPTNYNNRYYGRVDLRTALALSLNSISVQLTARSGVDEVIRTMRTLGIVSPIDRVLPISVGAVEITLWEHAYAYAAIAAGGKRLPRHPDAAMVGVFFTQILDDAGHELYANPLTPAEQLPQAVPADDAYAMIHLMKGVVENGTGRRVRELRRPAGGKTGTTNDFRDVWFLGFTTDLVAGVWVGRMTPQPITKEATGGGVALPIWLAFMKAAHPDTPPRDFPVPPDVTLMVGSDGTLVPFQRGRIPQKYRLSDKPSGFAPDRPF